MCRPDADEMPTEKVCEDGKARLAKAGLRELLGVKPFKFWA
jgi:hypothetical protein